MAGTIGVIDYGAGNLRNVLNALEMIGAAEVKLVAGPDDFEGVGQLVFPGVGAFGDCVSQLDRRGLREPLVGWLAADRPYFGICIGYQVLFEGSEECPGIAGLGHFRGQVGRFPTGDLKVPHMGWNTVVPQDPSDAVWAGLPARPHLYFVHSYFPRPDQAEIIAATTHYGVEFASAVRQGAIFASQFHPERSQSAGLRVLRNFLADAGAQLGPVGLVAKG
ncbi:MAG: imidazole glycerol phosphate synthase subunit HisH [Verrucomicrobiales bacterium]|nr:imidazole glycerol phosphate synthase subunit HisH [Verrucomicrobiales bacterium]